MFKEIKEQPELIKKISEKYLIDGKLYSWGKPKPGKIIMTGMGSSLFAAYPAYLKLLDHGYSVVWIDASEFLHYGLNSIKKEDTLLCISQSGESFEVVDVIKRCPNVDRIIGITAQTKSKMSGLCSETIDILSGTEESITSTKAHTATILLLNLLSLAWIGEQNEIKRLSSLLNQLAQEIEEVIENSECWCNDLLDELDIIRRIIR
jgi:glucosamine--fructose-6-phosphate aminotransferase (isomerizing)